MSTSQADRTFPHYPGRHSLLPRLAWSGKVCILLAVLGLLLAQRDGPLGGGRPLACPFPQLPGLKPVWPEEALGTSPSNLLTYRWTSLRVPEKPTCSAASPTPALDGGLALPETRLHAGADRRVRRAEVVVLGPLGRAVEAGGVERV